MDDMAYSSMMARMLLLCLGFSGAFISGGKGPIALSWWIRRAHLCWRGSRCFVLAVMACSSLRLTTTLQCLGSTPQLRQRLRGSVLPSALFLLLLRGPRHRLARRSDPRIRRNRCPPPPTSIGQLEGVLERLSACTYRPPSLKGLQGGG